MRRSNRLGKSHKVEPHPIFSIPEILRLIAIQLHLSDTRKLDSLAALARVNHLNNDVCTPILYRNVVFNRLECVTQFPSQFTYQNAALLAMSYGELMEADFDIDSFMLSRRGKKRTSRTVPTLVPSTIRAFNIWRYVESLELDHRMLGETARSLFNATKASFKHKSLLFPNLKRIIVRQQPDEVPWRPQTKSPSDLQLVLVLCGACRPEYCCMDIPKYADTHFRLDPFTPRGAMAPWNLLTILLPSLKTVIIHFSGKEIVSFLCSQTLHRFDWAVEDANSPHLENWARALPAALMMGEWEDEVGSIEVRDHFGMRNAVKEALDWWISNDSEDAELFRSFSDQFHFTPQDEARADCEACGAAMH